MAVCAGIPGSRGGGDGPFAVFGTDGVQRVLQFFQPFQFLHIYFHLLFLIFLLYHFFSTLWAEIPIIMRTMYNALKTFTPLVGEGLFIRII